MESFGKNKSTPGDGGGNRRSFQPGQSFFGGIAPGKSTSPGKPVSKKSPKAKPKKVSIVENKDIRPSRTKQMPINESEDDDYYDRLANQGGRALNDEQKKKTQKKMRPKMSPTTKKRRAAKVDSSVHLGASAKRRKKGGAVRASMSETSFNVEDALNDEDASDTFGSMSSNGGGAAPGGLDQFRQNLIDSLNMGDDEDGEGEPDLTKITPENVPAGFEEQARNNDGEFDIEKMSSMSKSARTSGRIKKIIGPKATEEDEEFAVDQDNEGFLYEPCMLPKEFWLRNRLRQRANRRRRMELGSTLQPQAGGGSTLPNKPSPLAIHDSADASERVRKLNAMLGSDEKSNGQPVQQQQQVRGRDMSIIEHSCGGKNTGVALLAFPQDIADDPRNALLEYEEGYDHAGCVACRRGTNGAAPIPIEALNNLVRNYVENRGYKDPEELAVDLEEQFEKCIRQPANANMKPGEQPIPIFTAEDIYFHMKKHDQSPEIWVSNTMEMLQNHLEQIYHSGVYRVARSRTRPGQNATGQSSSSYMNSKERYKRIRPQDIRVNEKYHKMMLDTIKMQHSLYKSKPTEMFMFNKNKTVKFDENRSWINSQRPMYTETNKKDDMWSKVKQRF